MYMYVVMYMYTQSKGKKNYSWSMIPKLALSNKNQLGQVWFLTEIRQCLTNVESANAIISHRDFI